MSLTKFCEACGRQASADARFCGGCGRALGAATASAAGSGAAERPAGAAESAAADVPGAEREVLRFGPVAVQGFLEFLFSILTAGILWIILLVARRRERYRLTTERLEIRTGLVTFTNRTIELFRIHDLEVREPFFLRMRGAGDLVIRSQDAAEAEVVLAAIPRVRDVHETVRGLVNAERRKQHVRVVEES
jgi:membrane protein YdbS with pleckstrin-like domain